MRRKRESGLIEPAIASLVARAATTQSSLLGDAEGKILRVVNDVWPWREGSGIGWVEVKENIEGFSTVYRGHPSYLPTSKDRLYYCVGVASKVFPFAIGQFVNVTYSQLVAEVRGRGAPFRSNIVGVLNVTLIHVAVRGSQ